MRHHWGAQVSKSKVRCTVHPFLIRRCSQCRCVRALLSYSRPQCDLHLRDGRVWDCHGNKSHGRKAHTERSLRQVSLRRLVMEKENREFYRVMVAYVTVERYRNVPLSCIEKQFFFNFFFDMFLFLLFGGVQVPCHSRRDIFLVRHQLR